MSYSQRGQLPGQQVDFRCANRITSVGTEPAIPLGDGHEVGRGVMGGNFDCDVKQASSFYRSFKREQGF